MLPFVWELFLQTVWKLTMVGPKENIAFDPVIDAYLAY